MQNKRKMILGLVWVFATLVGCAREKIPDGFPALVPCAITVTRCGVPEQGVVIMLTTTQGNSQLALSGTTDEKGVADLFTSQGSYMKSGIPQGQYKVVARKDIPLEQKSKLVEEMKSMTAEERAAFGREQKEIVARYKADREKLVPPALTQPSSTPLRLEVPAGGTSLSIELNDYTQK